MSNPIPDHLWQKWFAMHPEVSDCEAHRNELYRRALSLSDNDVVNSSHMDESLRLLVAEGYITPKPPKPKVDKEKNAETLKAFCARNYFHYGGSAVLAFLEQEYGNFTEHQIARALQQGDIRLAKWEPDEIAADQAQKAEQKQAEYQLWLKTEATVSELKEIAKQEREAKIREAQREQNQRSLEAAEQREQNLPRLPQHITKQHLEHLLKTNRAEFRRLLSRFGNAQLTAVLNSKPKVFGNN